jgi:exopolysacharide protein wzx
MKNKSNKYKVLLSNTAVFAVGSILVKLITFILMPLYTSMLTAEEYGISELLNSSTEIVIPITTLCIIEALYRFSIDKNVNYESIFINSFSIVILGDILVFICCIIGKKIFLYKYSYYFCGLYICITFYKMIIQFARGLGHVKRYAFYGVFNSLILVICNIVFLLKLNGGIVAYLYSFIISYGITGIVALIVSKEYKYFVWNSIDIKQLKEMLKYSIVIIPNMISWWVNSVSDRYILMLFWNIGDVGLYTAASKLPAMINLVSSIFQQAWQYSASKEINSRDKTDFFSNVLRGYMYICVCSCCCLILFNKIICKILLKTEFYNAWRFVPLLLMSAMFGCISTYFGTFYQALKDNSMLMLSTVIGAIINIILNIILIPPYAGIGAAMATLVSYIIVTVIRVIDITKKIYLNINWIRIFIQIFVLMLIMMLETFFHFEFVSVFEMLCLIFIVLSDLEFVKKVVNVFLFRRF